MTLQLQSNVRIIGETSAKYQKILTPAALEFVVDLDRKFRETRNEILARRHQRQRRLDAGEKPRFLLETAHIRLDESWSVSPNPADLQDRRVEITGPAADTKMVINAFNSGASVYMADFEDAQSPSWSNVIQGQINMRDAIRRRIRYVSPEGKEYSLNQKTAVLIVRPRGWHLDEKHVFVDDLPISGSLFDFGLYLFHNSEELKKRGTGPYFYLPKLECHLEARLWNDVFTYSEERLGLAKGTIRATVLIETILAAFEMDEILYELRDHCAGLNCGRWDYIFSFIKKFSRDTKFVLPDRAQVTMDKSFLAAYVSLLIKTCHKRGVHAIGGMAAQIPVKNNEANRIAFEKVRLDKLREVSAGHDGTWVAHPGLVPIAKEVFDENMREPNQLSSKKQFDVKIGKRELLDVPKGKITLEGVNTNISVGIQYLAAWLGGRGAVPINNLMEDAATCEISRAQLWQWVHHGAKLDSGETVTLEMFQRRLKDELARIRKEIGDEVYANSYLDLASKLFYDEVSAPEFPEFLTLPAYEALLKLKEIQE
ncbi:MAG: malate synthase A [Nitrososphaerota archaeon]|nr:malate synthase A [Nitrososphaerota archaeon]